MLGQKSPNGERPADRGTIDVDTWPVRGGPNDQGTVGMMRMILTQFTEGGRLIASSATDG